MSKVATKRDPAKWAKAKAKAKAKMGGKHSARAMQLAVKYYKDMGGGYKGKKGSKNKLSKWTKQKWTTESGKPSGKTGEVYAPKKTIDALRGTKKLARANAVKRLAKKAGKQYAKHGLHKGKKR
tara:strand:+ start:4087 stop:4458 length:372 start_codon:yes stop_codon:yes gene_type:complete